MTNSAQKIMIKKHTFLFVLVMLFFMLFKTNIISNSQNVGYNPNIVESVVIDSPKESQVDSMITFAKTFIGLPYKYGGNDPNGFDCSGYINYVYKQFGYELPRMSKDMAKLGEPIKYQKAEKGDLLFFMNKNGGKGIGHVSMVIYNNDKDSILMIHSVHRGIIVDNFMESSYYQARYITARHLGFFD